MVSPINPRTPFPIKVHNRVHKLHLTAHAKLAATESNQLPTLRGVVFEISETATSGNCVLSRSATRVRTRRLTCGTGLTPAPRNNADGHERGLYRIKSAVCEFR
jgi:hypothetical protein